MGISTKLAGILKENGIAVPTPIQTMAIPAALDGKDLIAQAQTGTGKTLAFILPILERIDGDAPHVQALIVTPTRELALQITAELNKLVSGSDVNVLAVYGGQDVEKQLKKLEKGVQVVVGTPGRLLDHIRRETVQLGNIATLVLDEADQMLHIGFLNEVEAIIRETPSSRQTMLFSATIPEDVRALAKKHMRNPDYMQVEKTQGPAETVNQLAVQTTDRGKQGALMELVNTHRPFMAVVFCRTKRRVGRLFEVLKANGFSCEELHGDLSQAKREQVMKRFRNVEFQLLIATDVAARGLDVEGVTHVFNYDMPEDAESYVHRIGRTGRAGTKGLAITLFTAADRQQLMAIEKELNIRIKKENAEGFKDTEPSGRRSAGKTDGGRQNSRRSPQAGNEGRPRKKSAAGPRRSDSNRDKKPLINSRKQAEAKTKRKESASPGRKSLANTGGRKSSASRPKQNQPSGRGRRK
ncbi:DEAD/DEAH box helicase [Neobacillus notoginsengisoli]|nr:DEAD/DEAH box helicase [Neobacillus notoginsengisoli]